MAGRPQSWMLEGQDRFRFANRIRVAVARTDALEPTILAGISDQHRREETTTR